MKILWLGWEDIYASHRTRIAAESVGIQFDALEIFDVSFISDSQRAGIFNQAINLLALLAVSRLGKKQR
jgi:hypothetical protein